MKKYINKYIQNEVDNINIDLERIYEDRYTFTLKIEAQELTINVPQLLLTEKYETECIPCNSPRPFRRDCSRSHLRNLLALAGDLYLGVSPVRRNA